MRYPTHLLRLIDALKRLSGVGNKSAERFAFEMLNWPIEHHLEFAELVKNISTKLRHCTNCGCLLDEEPCHFCIEGRHLSGFLCVIAQPRDAYAIENTREYKGLYHVLGGLLSPMDGFDADQLDVQKLKKRITDHSIKEVVIALDATLEGDTTALYLKRELTSCPVTISRIAFGLPMGSSLEYVDGGTLARAFLGRARF